MKPTQSLEVATPLVSGTPRKRRFCGLPDTVPRRGIRSACGEEPEEAFCVACAISVRRVTDRRARLESAYSSGTVAEAVLGYRARCQDQTVFSLSTLACPLRYRRRKVLLRSSLRGRIESWARMD